MIPTLMCLVVYGLGLAVTLALGPRAKLRLCAALAFPTGLTVTVVAELLVLALGIPWTAVSAAVAALAIAAAAVLAIVRSGGLPAGSWRTLAAWTLAFVAVTFPFGVHSLAILSFDSHFIVALGGAIGNDHGFAPGMLDRLANYGVFQVLVQSWSAFTPWSYVWTVAPVFALSTAVAFAVLLDDGLEALGVRVRGRWPAVALTTLAAFTAYQVFRHGVYIHTNFACGAYLCFFAALYWTAEVTGDPSRLPLAFVALTAFALQRIEAPLACSIFLVLAVLPSRLPARAILRSLAGYTVVVVAWYLLLARSVPVKSEFLTPTRAYALAGITLAFFAWFVAAGAPRLAFLRRVNQRAPAIVAALFVLALAAAFALRGSHMAQSAYAWLWLTLVQAPYWQGAWPVVAVFALVGLAAPAPPSRWVFVIGVPAYMALILLLVLNRTPYYKGLGDSASRMAVHLVPLAFFYLGLKFIPLLGGVAAPAPARAAAEAP